jgi:hypothetical protein
MNQPRNLREQMPRTAKRVDIMRSKFGAELVNAHIKRGMAGEAGHFYARERGFEVGTPTAGFAAFCDLADMLGASFKFEVSDEIKLRRPPPRFVIAMGADGVDFFKLNERLI